MRFQRQSLSFAFGSRMNARVSLIAATGLFVLTMWASAATGGELQRLTSNLQRAKTQTEMNVASKKLAEFWDAKLSGVEEKIQGRLDARERKEFAESKKRWRSYRSTEVAFRASFFEGGSIQPLIANTAYSQITEHRVSELESLFTDALNGRVEPDGAANGSQPIRSETKRMSSAAGSSR